MNGAKGFQDRFSWLHRLGDYVIAHTDGSISVLVSLKGVDTCFHSLEELQQAYSPFANVLQNLPKNLLLEWHLWREYDDTKSQDYLRKQEQVTRGYAISHLVRTSLAAHLKPYTVTNHLGLVITLAPERGVIPHLRRMTSQGYRVKAQEQAVTELLDIAQRMAFHLQGEVEPVERFSEAIQRSYHRDRFDEGQNIQLSLSDRFPWNYQLVSVKPDYLPESGVLKVNQTFTWVGLLKTTPEHIYSNFGQSLMSLIRGGHLGSGEIDIHICYLTTLGNAKQSAAKSEKDARDTQNLQQSSGGVFNTKRANDAQGFAQDVADHEMSVLNNCWIIHIHSKVLTRLQQRVAEIREQLDKANAHLVSNEDISWAYWRVAMPGQGHWNRFWRMHSHPYCAYMVPGIKFGRGAEEATSLRMTAAGEAISIHHDPYKATHASIIGKTGTGKGAIKTLEIIETGSLDTDWYIIEKGSTHLFTVAALGGIYIKIDPGKHVINPFPTYQEVDTETGEHFSEYVEGFIKGIGFALVGSGGFEALSGAKVEHYKAVAEKALLMLYETPERAQATLAPNLRDYLGRLQQYQDPKITANAHQRAAAVEMASHLESFLDTARGRIFTQETNLTIKPGIVGLDFSLLENQPEMAAAMLAFTCMRFASYAYFGKRKSRVLLEECHAFSSNRSVVNLAKNIATMGRKNSCSIEISGQSYKQFEGFNELDEQLCMRSQFFVTSGHEEVAESSQMPSEALAEWKNFEDPDRRSSNRTYRNLLLGYNEDWYQLVITLPDILLEWVNTNDQATMLARERIVSDLKKEAISRYRDQQKQQAATNKWAYRYESDALILSQMDFELDPYEMLRRLRTWQANQPEPLMQSPVNHTKIPAMV